MRAALALILGLVAAASTTPGHAYSLRSAVSDSCHERITLESLTDLLDLVEDSTDIELPPDPLLDRLLETIQFPGTIESDDATRFVLFSVIVGVRAPDTDGHSTLNLSALRRLHADPAARGQYAHALRGPADDGVEGDIAAVDGTLDAILEEVGLGVELGASGAIEGRPAYLDHYGRVDVPVLLFAWHVGRAIHALQDAHAHMVWDAEVEHVVGVLNYVDAVEGHLGPADGLAHSNALDDCDDAAVAPMVAAATRRTKALVRAIVTAINTRDDAPLRAGLAPCADDATDPEGCGWLVYNPACRDAVARGDAAAIDGACCTDANDFCGSPFAAVARQRPVKPYLGCGARPGGTSGWLWLAALALVVVGLRRRRVALALLAGLALAPEPAAAEEGAADVARPAPPRLAITLEGHGAALDDRVDSAILAPALGYGVRAAWRVGRWRFGLYVDRDHWVSIEYGRRLDAGVLDVAAFGEALFFDDYLRVGLGVGTSTLLFDTALHSTGQTGLFVDARPIGLRFPVTDGLWVVLDPFTTTVVIPAIEPDERLPSLRKVQRRTVVGLEACFL